MDELESNIKGIGKVIRIDVNTDDGWVASQRYGINSVPTFVVFNGSGIPTYRCVGVPDKNRLQDEVSKAAVSRTN